MKYPVVVALTLGLFSGVANAVESANFSAKENEDTPRVQSFYRSQCTEWSRADWIQTDQREAFIAQCMQNMKLAWPVGIEADQGE